MKLRLKTYPNWSDFEKEKENVRSATPMSSMRFDEISEGRWRRHQNKTPINQDVLMNITGHGDDRYGDHQRDCNHINDCPHYARVDTATGLINYYADVSAMIRGKRTETRPGRFLTRFFVDPDGNVPSNASVKKFAELLKAHAERYELRFVETSDEMRKVYKKGPGSCMQYPRLAHEVICEDDIVRNLHPVAVYQSPDIELAYMVDTMREDKIISRCLIDRRDPEKRRHGIIYGEVAGMDNMLKEKGIEGASCGLNGCRIRKLRLADCHRSYLMPYIDYAEFVGEHSDDDGDWFVIDGGSGRDYESQNTNGSTNESTRVEDQSECEGCNEDFPEDEVRPYYLYDPSDKSNRLDGLDLCEDCRHEYYVESGDHSGSHDIYSQESGIIIYEDCGYSISKADVEFCEDGEYRHINETCHIEVEGLSKIYHTESPAVKWDSESREYILISKENSK